MMNYRGCTWIDPSRGAQDDKEKINMMCCRLKFHLGVRRLFAPRRR
jgi:hypothetical protein